MAVATTMISYGGFLGACGWYGAHTSGAMHSLYAGVGSGAVMIMCGANSFGEPKKGDKDYKKWMIAVHLGLMFNALFTVVFCVQYHWLIAADIDDHTIALMNCDVQNMTSI